MAVLSDADREELRNHCAQRFLRLFPGSLTKAEARLVVNAADDWINDNAAAYNTALPANYRTTATAAQKARLLTEVALRRYDKGV